MLPAIGRPFAPPTDETVMVGLAGAVLSAFVLALLDMALRLRLLSLLARRVAFVLIPPLILIFLVLGTVFLGVATPTEGGAMGATGALVLAGARGRLTMRECGAALDHQARLLRDVRADRLDRVQPHLPGRGRPCLGRTSVRQVAGRSDGVLIFVTTLVFFLGMFLDFFEIAFILLPLLGPIADKVGIDLIWFGVLVGINLQTSFMTPPFGFVLFYLRSVAPKEDHFDAQTGLTTSAVRTSDIYFGAPPFVVVQVLVMALVIAFSVLVLGDAAKAKPKLDRATIEQEMRDMGGPAPAQSGPDPIQQLLDSMKHNP